MYVYQRAERNLWTVGDYTSGGWIPESDHDSPEKAAARVRFLNGGNAKAQIIAQLLEACEAFVEAWAG
jgi:hypothetical protein